MELLTKNNSVQLYNLRSSAFKYYALGLEYKAKKYVPSLERRSQQLEADLKGEDIPLPSFANKFVKYGEEHEICGIAKWLLVNQEEPKNYGVNQENYVIQDWLNDGSNISISTTPDGISEDDSRLIEVKCSAMGKKNYPKFPMEHLPQIAGQMMILNMLNIPVKMVNLVNWTPTKTKIWVYERNKDYENYLIDCLEHYSMCLLGKEKLCEPVEYEGEIKTQLIYDSEKREET